MDIHSVIKKIYWTIALLLSFPVFLNINLNIYKVFMESYIAFTLDTLYRDWNTTFPTVTVCEIYNSEKLWDISEKYFGNDRNPKIDEVLGEVVFFKGLCPSCELCNEIECPKDLNSIQNKFRATCQELISNCFWLEMPIDCCEAFSPLETEQGLCFSFNSMQSGPQYAPRFYNDRTTGPGSILFSVAEDIEIFVHAPNDVPNLHPEGIITEIVPFGTKKEIILNIIETVNDPSVFGYLPELRNCRFYDEINKTDNPFYKHYSHSTCKVDCTKNAYLQYCNCIPHLLPKVYDESIHPRCGISDLSCISRNYDKFEEILKDCKCLSSCEDPEFNLLYISINAQNSESDSTIIQVSIPNLPTQRYIRSVVKTSLDVVIAIGGIASLFFGASVISMAEIITKIFSLIKNWMGKTK